MKKKGPSASHDWRLLVLAVQDQCRWLRQYVDSSPRTLERLARGSEIYPPWHGQSWLCRWAPGCAAQKAGFAGIGAALSQAWAHWNIPGFSVQGHLGRWLPNQTGVHLPEVLPGARRGPQGRHEFSFAPGSGKYRRACATCIGFTCNRCLFVCLFVKVPLFTLWTLSIFLVIHACIHISFCHTMVVVPIFGHATAPAPAGAYDCIRHLHIRQNYTTVWVTTDGRVVDAPQTLHARSWAFRAWSLCEDLVDSWRLRSHSSRSQHVPEEEETRYAQEVCQVEEDAFGSRRRRCVCIPSRGQWMLSCRKIAQRNFFLVWWPKPVQCRSWMPVAKRKKHFAWLRPIRVADASVRAPMGTSAHVTTRWLHLKSTSVSSMTPSKRQLSMQCLIGRNPKLISPFSSPKQSPRASKSSRSKAIGFWMNVVGCVASAEFQ